MAIAAVIHGQQIDAHLVINRPQVIVVRHDFSIAMEEKNIDSVADTCVETRTDMTVACHGNVVIAYTRVCRGRVDRFTRMENHFKYPWVVELCIGVCLLLSHSAAPEC